MFDSKKEPIDPGPGPGPDPDLGTEPGGWFWPAGEASVVLETGEAVLVCFNASEVETMHAHGMRLADLSRRLGPDRHGALA